MTSIRTFIVTLSILTPVLALSQSLTKSLDFCSNPAAVVCADSNQIAKNYKKLTQDLFQTAYAEMKKTNPLISLKSDELDVSQIAPDLQDSLQEKFAVAVLNLFESSLTKNNLLPTNEQLQALKLESGTFISKTFANPQLKEELQKINIILTRSQYQKMFRTFSADIQSAPGVENFYDRACGHLEQQAIYEKSQAFLIVCPGLVLHSIANRESLAQVKPTDLMSNLSFVLAHEVAHAVDDYNTMGEFYQCVKKDSSFKAAEFDFKKRRETYADFFGYHFLSSQLKTISDVKLKQEFVKQNLKSLCLAKTSEEHPSTKFRINVLLDYPEVSQQLGCKTKPQLQCR